MPREFLAKKVAYLGAYRIGPSSVGDFFAPSIPLVRHIISAPSAPPAAASHSSSALNLTAATLPPCARAVLPGAFFTTHG